MGLFEKFAPERRGTSTLSNPAQWLMSALGATPGYSGKTVSVESAHELPAFYRGVNILANAFGNAPCKLYRRTADGSEEVRGSRAYQLLHDRPNSRMAADEFWAIVSRCIETWGNAYIYKERGGDGRIANLWPIRPERFAVLENDDRSLSYIVDGKVDSPLSDLQILHIRGLSQDGIVGYSSVQLAKQTLGSEMARIEYAGRFWANDATPGVTLIHPNKLSDEAVKRVKRLWKEAHQGTQNAREPAVLAEDMKIEQLSLPLEDAQFIEQARFSRTDIALMLGLPPYMLAGDSGGDSLQYSTTESHSLDLLKWTVGPRFVRVQNAVSNDPDLMPTNHFAKFTDQAILRATTKERYDAFAIAPHLTIGEARKADDLPPLGDERDDMLIAELKRPPAKDTSQEADPSKPDATPTEGQQ